LRAEKYSPRVKQVTGLYLARLFAPCPRIPRRPFELASIGQHDRCHAVGWWPRGPWSVLIWVGVMAGMATERRVTKPQGLSAASPCIPADARVPAPSPIGFRFPEGPGSQHRLRYTNQLLNRRHLRTVYRIAIQFQHSTQHSRIIIRRMQM